MTGMLPPVAVTATASGPSPAAHASSEPAAGKAWLAGVAWAVMLLVSDLPEIVGHHAGAKLPAGLAWAKLGLLLLFLGLTLAWRALRPLLGYAVVLSALFAALNVTSLVRGTGWYQSRFNSPGVSFFTGYAAIYVLDLAVAGVVLLALWRLKGRREAFFLVKGDLDAPIGRVPWLGIRRSEPWRKFVFIFAAMAGLAVLVPTVLALHPTRENLISALPLLPAVLLFAAVNAFTEEVYFRASFLATLNETVGRSHTLLISIAFFGLAHYLHGSPPGIVGAAMTGFLAYLLGKAMLETRGLLAPWFVHFVPDVVVFASYALSFARG
jgi:membrane protease YdiL (CAAX protease family)